MIVECGQCQRKYDASTLEPRAVVHCQCGDLLIVPEGEQLETLHVVEKYLDRWAQEHGQSAEQLRANQGWEFIAGSALVRVEQDAADETVTIEAAMLPVPEKAETQLALFTRLLELNHRTTGEARFAVRDQEVVVTFTRPTLGLDYLEFQRAIEEVARTADDYDDELTAEFGAAEENDE